MDPKPPPQTLDIGRGANECPICGHRFEGDARYCPFDGVELDMQSGPRSDPMIGRLLGGRYDVLEVLGQGGTGRVYKVRRLPDARLFAMKVIRRDLAHDDEVARRFTQEADATARVRHPNVVAVVDYGTLPDGILFLVTELLAGSTLGKVLRDSGPMDPWRAARIARQMAEGLGAAHSAGVVHRDLKPDNVFLLIGPGDGEADEGPSARFEDRVTIVDFGAAKLAGASQRTHDGIAFGTPHYMSPEQAGGQPVDSRSDVYSLGVMMYEMLTGRVPFDADSYMGVLNQHMFVNPVPPSQMGVGRRNLGLLENVVLICLAKRREDRYPSMESLARDLDRAIAARADEGHDSTRLRSRAVRSSRRRWMASGAAAVALSVAAWMKLAHQTPGPTRYRLSAEAPVVAIPDSHEPARAKATAALAPAVAASMTQAAPSAIGDPSLSEKVDAGIAAGGPHVRPARSIGSRPAGRAANALDDVGDPFATPR